MPWIFFLLALGCFALAMRTQSMGFALLLLLAALGLMLAGALGLIAARVQSRSSSGGMTLNPALEKQRLAQQRGATGATSGSHAGSSDTGSSSRAPKDDGRSDSQDGNGADGGGDGGGGGGD